MEWIERRLDAYENPEMVLPNVRSVMMVGLNYACDDPVEPQPGQGRFSRYAWNDCDYHSILRDKLKQVAKLLRAEAPDVRTRSVVDTAPLLERDFARLAGLGWFGKNTLLINKFQGSWLFLGAMLLDCELEYDSAHETSHCGTCTRCLDACPTDAFPEPYVLDATKCISYLNIELRDQAVPESLREGMGNWVFGCDICQDVCPWNRKAPTDNMDFSPREGSNPVDLQELLSLSEDEFAKRFQGTPLGRTGRNTLARTATIALGNTGDANCVPVLEQATQDDSALVAESAALALKALKQRLERSA